MAVRAVSAAGDGTGDYWPCDSFLAQAGTAAAPQLSAAGGAGRRGGTAGRQQPHERVTGADSVSGAGGVRAAGGGWLVGAAGTAGRGGIDFTADGAGAGRAFRLSAACL